jgi:hypothetical protein
MTYTKPEVAVLGNASNLIEALSKTGTPSDGSPYFANPAYDLDE